MVADVKRTLVLLAVITAFAACAQATLVVQGTDEEKKAINDAITEIQNGSATAKGIIDDLKKAETGDVVVKFGNTSDIATATKPPPTITLDKNAIAKMKQVGEGKALEQFSLPYLLLHEGWHILHWDNTEAQTVAKVNEVRTERGSSKRTKYEPDKVGGKLYLPFDDGSKVDLTDALRTGSDTKRAVDFWQSANLMLEGISMPDGVVLGLPGGAPQPMELAIPPEYGGGIAMVEVLSLSAELTPAFTDDFSLSVSSFHMAFSSFELDGKPTGINEIDFYLPHQTPYGDWTYEGDPAVPFTFDVSGDLGWSNSLFTTDASMAYERLIGSMMPAPGGWIGSCQFVGVLFGEIPELGDFDGNGSVGAGDLNLVLGSWGAPVVPPTWVNWVRDMPVGAEQLNLVLGNWGGGLSLLDVDEIVAMTGLSEAQVLAMIPDPATAVLMMLGGAAIALKRRQRCDESDG